MSCDKFIQVDDGGYIWRFPADRVAANYAKYLEDKFGEDYDLNFTAILEDDFELIDWFINNMDWDDVSDCAALVQEPPK